MWVPTPYLPLVAPGSIDLLDAEKAQALASSLETQFQPVNDPPEPSVVEVSEALRAYFTLASEPQLTNPAEVQVAIRGLRVDNTSGPNGLPNRALQHPQRATSLLVNILNALVRSCHFAPICKCARVISILKSGSDLAQP